MAGVRPACRRTGVEQPGLPTSIGPEAPACGSGSRGPEPSPSDRARTEGAMSSSANHVPHGAGAEMPTIVVLAQRPAPGQVRSITGSRTGGVVTASAADCGTSSPAAGSDGVRACWSCMRPDPHTGDNRLSASAGLSRDEPGDELPIPPSLRSPVPGDERSTRCWVAMGRHQGQSPFR